jgi:Flp pilus assembly protein TadG
MMNPRSLRCFRRDIRAVSAVEFALVLPFLLALYIGGIELSQAISINRKATLVARTVSDLVAQAEEEKITPAEVEGILNAAEAIMAPYPASNTRVVVSSVEITDDGATVLWSRARNASQRAKGDSVTLPPGIGAETASIIMAEVHYPYTPTLGSDIIGNIDLSETIYMRPRQVPVVDIAAN